MCGLASQPAPPKERLEKKKDEGLAPTFFIRSKGLASFLPLFFHLFFSFLFVFWFFFFFVGFFFFGFFFFGGFLVGICEGKGRKEGMTRAQGLCGMHRAGGFLWGKGKEGGWLLR